MADTNLSLLGTGTAGAVLSVLLLLYKTFNHKKCRSRCCGQVLDASFEAGDITPPDFVVVNPHAVASHRQADGYKADTGLRPAPPVAVPPVSVLGP